MRLDEETLDFEVDWRRQAVFADREIWHFGNGNLEIAS